MIRQALNDMTKSTSQLFMRGKEGVATTQRKLVENIIHVELQSNIKKIDLLRKKQIGGYLYFSVGKDQTYIVRMPKTKNSKEFNS